MKILQLSATALALATALASCTLDDPKIQGDDNTQGGDASQYENPFKTKRLTDAYVQSARYDETAKNLSLTYNVDGNIESLRTSNYYNGNDNLYQLEYGIDGNILKINRSYRDEAAYTDEYNTLGHSIQIYSDIEWTEKGYVASCNRLTIHEWEMQSYDQDGYWQVTPQHTEETTAMTFTYDEEGHLTAFTVGSAEYEQTWQDGNLMKSMQEDGKVVVYEYTEVLNLFDQWDYSLPLFDQLQSIGIFGRPSACWPSTYSIARLAESDDEGATATTGGVVKRKVCYNLYDGIINEVRVFYSDTDYFSIEYSYSSK